MRRATAPSTRGPTAACDGGTPLVKVLDFGISKSTARATVIARNDSVMGTSGYMPPEHMKATEGHARTDVWSLGVVLSECLTGRCPFQSESFAALIFDRDRRYNLVAKRRAARRLTLTVRSWNEQIRWITLS